MLDAENRPSGVDQGSTRGDPWLTMDYYLGDSRTLQDMMDVDMKCENQEFIGGHLDLDLNLTDLPFELDDDPVGCQSDLHGWLGSASLLNGNSNSSHSNFNLDLSGGDAASVMVNPNSVMPHVIARAATPTSANPTNATRRHFSFTSAIDIKEEKADIKEECDDAVNESDTEHYEDDITETEDDDEDEDESDEEHEKQLAIVNAAVAKAKQQQQQQQQQQQLHFKTVQTVKTLSPQVGNKVANQQKINPLTHASIRVRNFKIVHNPMSQTQQHVRKQIYNNNVHVATSTSMSPSSLKRDKDFTVELNDYDEKPYPKPAYSYSCLIAMALKNSQTGSLPVSEIYNFMCEHFPYFKTAPNGWKNSVRHNLSLNKCFEKIEKPAGNGNQRKGCLWAINPNKIAKMDEEVQKWSRKDPLAIKNAMIYPDHLELLERGEMKYAGSGGDMSEETESSSDETAEENTTYDEPSLSHVAANSVTDSYDESSQDCDIDITEHVYDDIEIDDNKEALHMQLNISKQQSYDYELSPSTKRQKPVANSLQENYVFQAVAPSRRKTPLLVRTGSSSGSFLKMD